MAITYTIDSFDIIFSIITEMHCESGEEIIFHITDISNLTQTIEGQNQLVKNLFDHIKKLIANTPKITIKNITFMNEIDLSIFPHSLINEILRKTKEVNIPSIEFLGKCPSPELFYEQDPNINLIKKMPVSDSNPGMDSVLDTLAQELFPNPDNPELQFLQQEDKKTKEVQNVTTEQHEFTTNPHRRKRAIQGTIEEVEDEINTEKTGISSRRERNRQSAARSRQKKLDHTNALEDKVLHQEKRIKELEAEVKELRKENSKFKSQLRIGATTFFKSSNPDGESEKFFGATSLGMEK